MTYIIHYIWPYGYDKISFDTKEHTLAWLGNGFQPKEPTIWVEHDNICMPFNRNYKPYHKGGRTKAFNKLYAEQEAESLHMRKYLAKCKTHSTAQTN